MRTMPVLTATLVLLATTAPGWATACKEEITTLERRLDSVGAEKVTGKEPPQGATSSNSEKALDKPPEGKPSDPAVKPSSAGVDEAKKLVEKAKEQDKAGDLQGCQATMIQAKEKAGALP